VTAEQRISADSHMAEPPDLWEKRLPAELKDRALRFPNIKPFESGAFLRAGGWDPRERLRDQAYDGVSAEVLYPTLGYAAYGFGDVALEEACVRVYNDWMIEFCAVAPDRFWGLALVSLWDIDHAVKELLRCKRAGLRGAAIGLLPAEDIPYRSDHYERFWAACQDADMSLSFHINSGPGRAESEARIKKANALLPRSVYKHKVDCQLVLGELIGGGVLERFPNLKVVVAEAGVGWIPFFAQEFDYYQNSIFDEPWKYPLLPSGYIERQVYGSFISDEVGGYLLNKYGESNYMWSNDYPHGACIWPLSTGVIARDLGHLTSEARQKITAGTAAKLYNEGVLPPAADPPGEVQDMTTWEAHWHN
jgi:uncharacterized protein